MSEPAELCEQGKRAFEARRYDEAARLFGLAAEGYTLGRAGLLTAEMKNNQSVALLKANKPAQALAAVEGTELIFAGARDKKREAMAVGNHAAALEGLGRPDEALVLYQRAAEPFREAGEGQMRAMVLKAAAGIELKRGALTESGLRMMEALKTKDRPNLLERALKSVLGRKR